MSVQLGLLHIQNLKVIRKPTDTRFTSNHFECFPSKASSDSILVAKIRKGTSKLNNWHKMFTASSTEVPRQGLGLQGSGKAESTCSGWSHWAGPFSQVLGAQRAGDTRKQGLCFALKSELSTDI